MKRKDPTNVLVLVFSILLAIGGIISTWFARSSYLETRKSKQEVQERRNKLRKQVKDKRNQLIAVSKLIGWKEQFINITRKDGNFEKIEIPSINTQKKPVDKVRKVLKSRGYTSKAIDSIVKDDALVESILRQEYTNRLDRVRTAVTELQSMGSDLNQRSQIRTTLKTTSRNLDYPLSEHETWAFNYQNNLFSKSYTKLNTEENTGARLIPLIEWYRQTIQTVQKRINDHESRIDSMRKQFRKIVGQKTEESEGKLANLIKEQSRKIQEKQKKAESLINQINSAREQKLRRKESIEKLKQKHRMESEKQKKQFEREQQQIMGQIEQIQERLKAVREAQTPETIKEGTDGKVLYTNLNNETAYINLGTKDGLLAGQEFEVFNIRKGGLKVEKGKIKTEEVYEEFARTVIISHNKPSYNPISQDDLIRSRSFNKNTPKIFVFAGTMQGEYNEDMLTHLIQKRGNKVKNRVTNKTNFLVVGEGYKHDPTYKKAIELGIKTINQKQLERLLNLR